MKIRIIITCLSILSIGSISHGQSKKALKAKVAKLEQEVDSLSKLNPSAELKNDMDSLAYAIGFNIGTNFKRDGLEDINVAAFSQGIKDAIEGKDVDVNQMNAVVQKWQRKKQVEMEKEQQEAGREVKEAGEKYLAENGKREEVTTLPSGLQYEILKEGDGKKPSIADKVKVHYHGTMADGTVFDSSVDRGTPAEFGLQGVISGWTEILQLMPTGSKWKVYIPYNLAYGERGRGGPIKPYSMLIFEIELLEIVGNNPKPAAQPHDHSDPNHKH